MSKKTMAITIMGMILFTGLTTVSAIEMKKVDKAECLSYETAIFSMLENFKTNDVNGVMWTTGPISKRISEINLIDGSADNIQQIEEVLDRPKLKSLPFAVIEVSNLTFSITYKRRIFFPWPSYTYATSILNQTEDQFILGKKHTITVKNFEGNFISMINFPLRPCRFSFGGFYEEAIITYE